jgi:hypothetical protein
MVREHGGVKLLVLVLLLMGPAYAWAWTVTERCELARETPKGTVTVAQNPNGILLYLPEGLAAEGISVKVSFGSRSWQTPLVGGAVELTGGAKPFLEKNWATVHADGENLLGFNLSGSSEAWEKLQECESDIDEGGWVSLIGEISASTDDEIIRAIRRQRPEGLILDSPGGLAEEAQRIGYAVRGAGLATKVQADAQCLAECTFVLAAGKPRTVEEKGRAGVPAQLIIQGLGVFQGDQESVADTAVYFGAMGVDGGKLAVLATSAREKDVRVLTRQELHSVGLVDESAPVTKSTTIGRLSGSAELDWWLIGSLLGVVGALGWGLNKIRRRA